MFIGFAQDQRIISLAQKKYDQVWPQTLFVARTARSTSHVPYEEWRNVKNTGVSENSFGVAHFSSSDAVI
ncbi:hypothetical protein [Pseudomonas coronafaciens]|uniref:hypothetical protein n=1 Tax=Pseudomonas coronafaciens TaxID=53409 RepID=UPI0011C40EA2|nr:hypothetical protein [Pseudomonas coronafaciens]